MSRKRNKPSRAMRALATRKAMRRAAMGWSIEVEAAVNKLRAEGPIPRSVIDNMRRMDRVAARLHVALSCATWEAVARGIMNAKGRSAQ